MNLTPSAFKVLITLSISLFFNYFVIAQENKKLTIVTFGDSTTANRRGVDSVFAIRLADILKKYGIDNNVVNSGVGSSHTGSIKDNNFAKVEHAMDRFDKSVLSHNPDWVTINFGLNDSWQDKGQQGTSRIPLEQYKSNLSYFIQKVKNQNGKVILLPPNPIGKKFEVWRYARVKEYRKVVKELARSENTYFIDSWKLFYKYARKNKKEIDILFTDGIHPNDIGHKLIAEAVSGIIVRKEK